MVSADDPLILVFARCLKVPERELNDASSPDTIASWDSLAAMSLVSELEETFRVSLSTREIMRMRTIGVAREVLRQKGVTGI